MTLCTRPALSLSHAYNSPTCKHLHCAWGLLCDKDCFSFCLKETSIDTGGRRVRAILPVLEKGVTASHTQERRVVISRRHLYSPGEREREVGQHQHKSNNKQKILPLTLYKCSAPHPLLLYTDWSSRGRWKPLEVDRMRVVSEVPLPPLELLAADVKSSRFSGNCIGAAAVFLRCETDRHRKRAEGRRGGSVVVLTPMTSAFIPLSSKHHTARCLPRTVSS